jgi:hypothetical protein
VSCSPGRWTWETYLQFHAFAVWPACGIMQVWVDSKRRDFPLGIIHFLDLRFLEHAWGFWVGRYALMRDTRGRLFSLPDAGSAFEVHARACLQPPDSTFWIVWCLVFGKRGMRVFGSFQVLLTIIGQSTTTGLRQQPASGDGMLEPHVSDSLDRGLLPVHVNTSGLKTEAR